MHPGSDKIEDADLRLHPGKAIIDTAKNTKKNSLRMEKPGKIIDTEEIIDPGKEVVRTLNPGEDGKGAVPTLNSGSDKIIDTGEDADLSAPWKGYYRHCNTAKIIDTD